MSKPDIVSNKVTLAMYDYEIIEIIHGIEFKCECRVIVHG